MCVGECGREGVKYSIKAFFHDDLQVFIEARVCCPWLVVISRDIVPEEEKKLVNGQPSLVRDKSTQIPVKA